MKEALRKIKEKEKLDTNFNIRVINTNLLNVLILLN